MNVERLVTMANDIAAFFHSSADPNEAPDKVASHLRLYWHPNMRTQIVAHYHAGGAGLSDLAMTGVKRLANDAIDPVARTKRTSATGNGN